MATKAGEIDGDVKASPDTVETIVQDTNAETTKDAQEAAPPKAAELESFEDAPDPEEDDLDDLDGGYPANPSRSDILWLIYLF